MLTTLTLVAKTLFMATPIKVNDTVYHATWTEHSGEEVGEYVVTYLADGYATCKDTHPMARGAKESLPVGQLDSTKSGALGNLGDRLQAAVTDIRSAARNAG